MSEFFSLSPWGQSFPPMFLQPTMPNFSHMMAQQMKFNIHTQHYITFITLITVGQLAISAMQDTTVDNLKEHLNQIKEWLTFAQDSVDEPIKHAYTPLITQTDNILKQTTQIKDAHDAQTQLADLLNNVMSFFFFGTSYYMAIPPVNG
jgi:DNA phosphorothioation-dependent restriction protein DptG